VRSLRLDPNLDERVRQAAEKEGVSVSEFLRRAAVDRVDRVLAELPSQRLADVIGSVRGDGADVASRTGEVFTDLLVEQQNR
jgi:hypothetical protein